MAHDIADILSKNRLTYYRDILAKEATFAEESRLILQIIETHRTPVSTAVVKVLNTIADVFTKRIADERHKRLPEAYRSFFGDYWGGGFVVSGKFCNFVG